MEHKNILDTFDESTLPDLDIVVLGALELFASIELPALDVKQFTTPLVVGSGNAAFTGRIIYGNTNAVFANESTYESELDQRTDIDGVVLISASGGKHAVTIAKDMAQRGLPLVLITNNPAPNAGEFVSEGNVLVFPKNREPYTYNTSTYMGMMLASSKENPQEILDVILHTVAPAIPQNLGNYNAFFLTVSPAFASLTSMFNTKFDELFAPAVTGRTFTTEEAKHAKAVVQSDTELFIHFGDAQMQFTTSEHKVNIPVPETIGVTGVLAIGYYVIGQIQKQHPPYYKENIAAYIENAEKVFGEEMGIIVE